MLLRFKSTTMSTQKAIPHEVPTPRSMPSAIRATHRSNDGSLRIEDLHLRGPKVSDRVS